ncbi:MAG: N-acetyltransferase [Pseudomonadota bacterium]
MSAHDEIRLSEANSKAAMAAFVNIAFQLNANDPHWVPPLKQDVFDMFNPAKNPFYGHATVQPMIATRDGRIVGRISAHIDHLAAEQPIEKGMGPGTGNWGMLEAEDGDVASSLVTAAEDWLRKQGMNRALGPLSLSVWDEPGLLVKGFEQDPTFMMGHHNQAQETWVQAAGYKPVKSLFTYELDITKDFPPLIQRIVKSGERSSKINVRGVDKSRFDEEAATILGILNDAWSDNWGFVPITDDEIAHVGKKLKPIVREDLIMIAEVEGEPVAFMMTLPDLNEAIKPLNGNLFPFGWAKLLWWLRTCRANTMRVPLMGVKKELQNSRLASQLAFMMIEYIKRNATSRYGATRGEIGWILEDNQGMVAIADAIDSHINKEYRLYEKAL